MFKSLKKTLVPNYDERYKETSEGWKQRVRWKSCWSQEVMRKDVSENSTFIVRL